MTRKNSISYSINATVEIPRRSFVLCILVLVSSYFYTIYAALYNQEHYAFLLKEDGPLENIATACVLLSAILFLGSYYKHRHPRNIFFLFFSIALFLLFMEEISWGQRIIDFQTPRFFKQTNAQGEINLHNFMPIYKYINGITYVCFALYMVGIPLLAIIYNSVHEFLVRYTIPVPSPATAFLTFFNFIVYTYLFEGFLFHQRSLGKHVNYGEMLETGIEIIFLYFSVECFFRGTTWLRRKSN